MTVRVRLVVAYDGSSFHGFALQPGQVTVAGALKAAIDRSLRADVSLVGAGRTDSGVHAWGQVVTFDADGERFDGPRLQRSVNKTLRPVIAVRGVEVVDPGFDARRSAVSRRYRYTVLNREVPDPFLAATTWHVPDELSLGALRLACDPIIGEHDFSSFCRPPRLHPDACLVRRVADARWLDLGDGRLRFEIEASAFCHQMVRSLVGTMVEMGRGRRPAGEMAGVLRARHRSQAGDIAPPHGLCLWSVAYPGFDSA
ncbi:MAG: tRNA pseudouridine38-40 synthase [Actinomycetota bacterium]|jgi:tRNA pseudouridine38-40 synthase|nr:tRNA pseudouridine38-40 synthase [Actinomycetota bacterium]